MFTSADFHISRCWGSAAATPTPGATCWRCLQLLGRAAAAATAPPCLRCASCRTGTAANAARIASHCVTCDANPCNANHSSSCVCVADAGNNRAGCPAAAAGWLGPGAWACLAAAVRGATAHRDAVGGLDTRLAGEAAAEAPGSRLQVRPVLSSPAAVRSGRLDGM